MQRLNARLPGLSVHMNQVHKETLNQVENALPNRSGLDVEIFGMEGIPQEILEQHRTRIVQNFYQAQEDRRIATGNPQPGQAKPPRKKIKIETAEELKKRVAEHRAKLAAARAAGASGSPVAGAPSSASPGAFVRFPGLFVFLLPWDAPPIVCLFTVLTFFFFTCSRTIHLTLPLRRPMAPPHLPTSSRRTRQADTPGTRRQRRSPRDRRAAPSRLRAYHSVRTKTRQEQERHQQAGLWATRLTSSSVWRNRESSRRANPGRGPRERRRRRRQVRARRRRSRRRAAGWCTPTTTSVPRSGSRSYRGTGGHRPCHSLLRRQVGTVEVEGFVG